MQYSIRNTLHTWMLKNQYHHYYYHQVWLSLEGKNLGIVTADADLGVAVEQCVLGSLSYNGQRCTAIKMIFVHRSLSAAFIEQMVEKVSALKCGLPWEAGVSITPLPEPSKPGYLRGLIDDAVDKGAAVVNKHLGGGELLPGSLLMRPAVVAPVTENMKLWHEVLLYST